MRGYFCVMFLRNHSAVGISEYYEVNQLCAPFAKVDTMKFTELGLAEPILRAVAEQGYDTPTPIQRKRFHRFWQVVICSPPRKQAQAKPQVLPCRFCNA